MRFGIALYRQQREEHDERDSHQQAAPQHVRGVEAVAAELEIRNVSQRRTVVPDHLDPAPGATT
jgi:hypothetical protein